VAWILDNVEGARARAERGELAFGTIDSWLIWHLTSGKRHVTDVTNASRTLLYNIVKGEWDEELLKIFGIPASMLPEVAWSSEKVGEVTTTLGLGGAAIAGIAGDQQAALFGQLCWSAGEAKNTYGTGCFLLQNVGTEFVRSRHRLITTLAASAGRRREYALEGSIFIGGAVVQWLRDNLKLIGSSGDVEALAASVPDTGGVVFVPAFVGLGAPHWDAHAAGMLIGLRRDTRPGHIARAALEAIAFQVADVLEAVHSETGGWRGERQRSADAVPGGRAGRAGGASAGDGDNGAGRGLSGGLGDGILGGPGGVAGQAEGRYAFRAADGRG
jgi:glycerol kinase